MFPVFMAFCAPAFYGLSNVFDARVTGKVFNRLTTVLFYNGLTNIALLPLILIFIGTPSAVPVSLWGYLAVLGFFECFYLFPYYSALKTGDTSVVIAMFSFGQILIPVLAYFLVGEKLVPTQYVGFFVIIAANLFLNLRTLRGFKMDAGFWKMLLSSSMSATSAVLYKKLLTELDWITVLFFATLLARGFACSLILVSDCRKDIVASFGTYKKNARLFLSMLLSSQAGYFSKLYALSFLPVVVLKSVGATQPLFVLCYGVFSYYVLHRPLAEGVGRRSIVKKTICFALIISSIVIILTKQGSPS